MPAFLGELSLKVPAFLSERPDLPVVAAGSLLEFALNDMKASMPVGRIEFHHLGPLSFEEFLLAAEGDVTRQALREWSWEQPWSATLHQRLLARMRDFLAVGGMPEATSAFVQDGDFAQVINIQRSITETYREDFSKYALGAQAEKVRKLFDVAPGFLGQKLRWSRVNPAWKSVDQRKAFDQLARAGVLFPVHHCDGTGLPLDATRDDGVFKLLHLDVGLVQNALGNFAMPLEQFQQGRFINEGPLAEQFVGQHLRHSPDGLRPELHYWLREGKSGNAEVDFLVAVDDLVVPVEVKSGSAGSMRSLHQFMALRGGHFAVRFDLNPPVPPTDTHRDRYDLGPQSRGLRTAFAAAGSGWTLARPREAMPPLSLAPLPALFASLTKPPRLYSVCT